MFRMCELLFCALIFVINCQFSSGSVLEDVNIDTRIIGGYDADIRNFPYQVSLQFFDQHFCGGALITPNTVLTAAHCFGMSQSKLSQYYQVKVGSNVTQGNTGQKIQMCSVKIHEKYNSTTIDHDVSIIKLCSNVTQNQYVQTIILSEKENYIASDYAVVSGWGYEVENGNLSVSLKAASVPLTTRKYCKNAYSSIIAITKNMICAGFAEGGKDACQGDSGGPLVYNNKLIGVVSFGAGCAKKGYPGVYSNVANLIDWIANNSEYSKRGSSAKANSLHLCMQIILLLMLGAVCINFRT